MLIGDGISRPILWVPRDLRRPFFAAWKQLDPIEPGRVWNQTILKEFAQADRAPFYRRHEAAIDGATLHTGRHRVTGFGCSHDNLE